MMDAKKYIEEYNRMCKFYGLDCRTCPGNHTDCNPDNLEMIDIVEKWSEEHPKITNADKFREVFGTDIYASTDCPGYFYLAEVGTTNRANALAWLDFVCTEPAKENN